ncbi:protein phosphatase 2C domain-containing protein [uncultured Corynebacterium sp.]|uniref:protein phosphatase 2C domain-containing protein n=1 Tax=uncultured Corynebacterium sp. TaxID=159447 RepID=UPI0025E777F0|nr:protein phosphatase 2C domain-containing protein [uncultured Corynebacterium sp.]
MTEGKTGNIGRTLNFAACSDRGLVRGNNEDSAYAGPRLLALADGMGGHAAGEVASQFLINALSPLDSPLIDEPNNRDQLENLLATATDEGNQDIAAHVDEHPNLDGMGCTLTSMLFREDEVAICHIGDSRGYVLRDGELRQVTKDDTFVQSLVDEGKLAPEDVSSHPQRSLILKALTGRPVEPTLWREKTQVGDRFMLCSDGLSDPVSIDTIREVLSRGTPEKAARKLVEMALRGGGPDNVTVVVADVVGFDANSNAPTDPELTLPPRPVMAGAIAGEAVDLPRPNSSAARAAAIQGLSTTTAASPKKDEEDDEPEPATAGGGHDRTGKGNNLHGDGHDAGDTEPSAAKKPKKSRRGLWVTLAIILAVVLAAGAVTYVMYQRVKDTYYVASDSSQIKVMNGTDSSVLGFKLNSVHQDVCLDDEGKATFVDPGAGGDCHLFKTSDLTPAAQGALSDLPEDSYDKVAGQVNRLAEQTLPVCVTRVPSDKNKNGTDKTDADKSDAAKNNTDKKDSKDNSKKSEAPEDLTTPGVSCREVK